MASRLTKAERESFEQALKCIIDDWFERVSGYYLTEEDENPDGREIELKRFHDKNGHRIKFNKGELDFTYGLRAGWKSSACELEISVNNKVEDFDYADFRNRLVEHYRIAGAKRITSPRTLGRALHHDVFQLESNLDKAFSVEKRSKQTEIMKLSFTLPGDAIAHLAKAPKRTRKLVEAYCVAPFRTIYAGVYRNT